MKKEVLINPTMKWACPPSEQSRLKFLDGMTDKWPALPVVGDELLVPFIVDPRSGQPVRVHVLDLVKQQGPTGHVMVIVVGCADRPH